MLSSDAEEGCKHCDRLDSQKRVERGTETPGDTRLGEPSLSEWQAKLELYRKMTHLNMHK